MPSLNSLCSCSMLFPKTRLRTLSFIPQINPLANTFVRNMHLPEYFMGKWKFGYIAFNRAKYDVIPSLDISLQKSLIYVSFLLSFLFYFWLSSPFPLLYPCKFHLLLPIFLLDILTFLSFLPFNLHVHIATQHSLLLSYYF